MGRAIEETFLKDLKEGDLKQLSEIVQRDDTLCLELRGNKVVIYYRGGALYTIIMKDDGYKIVFNEKYGKEYDCIKKDLDIKYAVDYLPHYKQTMDFYLGTHRKYEREFQQLILRENNNIKGMSAASDYFILDMEYSSSKKLGRFDMVAIEWKSISQERKRRNNRRLAFIEVKYGDDALDNLQKHIEDFSKFIENKEQLDSFCEDMQKVFSQKCELGLIEGNVAKKGKIIISREKPQLIFAFANHDPDKPRLNEELQMAMRNFPHIDVNQILVARSSEMGYGLYGYKEGECGKEDSIRFPNISEYCNKM